MKSREIFGNSNSWKQNHSCIFFALHRQKLNFLACFKAASSVILFNIRRAFLFSFFFLFKHIFCWVFNPLKYILSNKQFLNSNIQQGENSNVLAKIPSKLCSFHRALAARQFFVFSSDIIIHHMISHKLFCCDLEHIKKTVACRQKN